LLDLREVHLRGDLQVLLAVYRQHRALNLAQGRARVVSQEEAEPGVVDSVDGTFGKSAADAFQGFSLRLRHGGDDVFGSRAELRLRGLPILLMNDDVDQSPLGVALELQLRLRGPVRLEDELALRFEDLGTG